MRKNAVQRPVNTIIDAKADPGHLVGGSDLYVSNFQRQPPANPMKHRLIVASRKEYIQSSNREFDIVCWYNLKIK